MDIRNVLGRLAPRLHQARAVALVAFGACLVLAVNWWYSPERRIEAAGEAASRSSPAQREAYSKMWTALSATGGDSHYLAQCSIRRCYVSVTRMWFRSPRDSSDPTRFENWSATVEVDLEPVAGSIGKYLPTRFGWRQTGSRWSIAWKPLEADWRQRQVFSGTWQEIGKAPTIAGQKIFEVYLQTLAADIDAALEKELGDL